MQQRNDQEQPAQGRPSKEQEFTVALVKLGVLVCGAIAFHALTVLGMFIAYGVAELAVAWRMHTMRSTAPTSEG
jgi:hypothetical protein